MEKPNKKDYDFNDHFQVIRFSSDMINYSNYQDKKIEELREESKKYADALINTNDTFNRLGKDFLSQEKENKHLKDEVSHQDGEIEGYKLEIACLEGACDKLSAEGLELLSSKSRLLEYFSHFYINYLNILKCANSEDLRYCSSLIKQNDSIKEKALNYNEKG